MGHMSRSFFFKKVRNRNILKNYAKHELKMLLSKFWLAVETANPKGKALVARSISLKYKNSHKTKIKPRCFVTNRGSALVNMFKVSRIIAHQKFIKGEAAGIRRSSW